MAKIAACVERVSFALGGTIHPCKQRATRFRTTSNRAKGNGGKKREKKQQKSWPKGFYRSKTNRMCEDFGTECCPFPVPKACLQRSTPTLPSSRCTDANQRHIALPVNPDHVRQGVLAADVVLALSDSTVPWRSRFFFGGGVSITNC